MRGTVAKRERREARERGEYVKPRTRVTAGEVQQELNSIRREVIDAMHVYHQQVVLPHFMATMTKVAQYQPLWRRAYLAVWTPIVRWRVNREWKKKLAEIKVQPGSKGA